MNEGKIQEATKEVKGGAVTAERGVVDQRGRGMVRVAKNRENPYVQVNRSMLQNESLSWEARGMLSYLLSRPDESEIAVKDLVKLSPRAGRDKAYRIIEELEIAGYLSRQQQQKNSGQFGSWVIEIFPDGDAPTLDQRTGSRRREGISALELSLRTASVGGARKSFVYVVKNPDTGLCKIGHTASLARRFAQIKNGGHPSLVLLAKAYVEGALGHEQRILQELEAYCVHGEWFRLPNDRLAVEMVEALA